MSDQPAGNEAGNAANDAGTPGREYLQMVRDLPAEPPDVYAAWTDLARITSWWGPEGFIVPPDRVTSHQEVGGDYSACMVNTVTGDELWWSGEYRVLDPPWQLQLTQQWQEPDGTPSGGPTLITIELQPHGEGTSMTFRQGPFRDRRDREGQEGGWNESFSRLAGYLARHRRE